MNWQVYDRGDLGALAATGAHECQRFRRRTAGPLALVVVEVAAHRGLPGLPRRGVGTEAWGL